MNYGVDIEQILLRAFYFISVSAVKINIICILKLVKYNQRPTVHSRIIGTHGKDESKDCALWFIGLISDWNNREC